MSSVGTDGPKVDWGTLEVELVWRQRLEVGQA